MADWKKIYRRLTYTIIAVVVIALLLAVNYLPNVLEFHKFKAFLPQKGTSINERLYFDSNNTNDTWHKRILSGENKSSNESDTGNKEILLGIDQLITTRTNDVLNESKGIDTERKRYLSLLREKGYESVEEHHFKSPFIVDPPFYQISNDYTVPKAPGKRTTKVISLINMFSHNDWFSTDAKFDFSNCPYRECMIDQHGVKAKDADVVLFICLGLKPFPTFKRRPEQLWGLTCHESPEYSSYQGIDPKVFNFTSGYIITDSDVWYPFVELHWRDKSTLKTYEEHLSVAKSKTKTAVWVARNCRNPRLKFVLEMKKYMNIDIFGHCGSLSCARGNEEKCLRDYKFYLAFENSYCPDYVTEKLHLRFYHENNPIPVVKGGADYDKYFPNNTFINGEHFATAKDLALYLKDLANDDLRYAKILQEKDKLKASIDYPVLHWCSLCEAAHTNKLDIKTNIYETTNKPCTTSNFRI